MGNYYRSRLGEELTLHYAPQHGVDVEVDSGGLSDVEHSNNPGPISKSVLRFLDERGIEPKGARRYPKHCEAEIIYAADIVVLTDKDEQLHLFMDEFPDFSGELISWQARDHYADPLLQTPNMIEKHVQALLKELAKR